MKDIISFRLNFNAGSCCLIIKYCQRDYYVTTLTLFSINLIYLLFHILIG